MLVWAGHVNSLKLAASKVEFQASLEMNFFQIAGE